MTLRKAFRSYDEYREHFSRLVELEREEEMRRHEAEIRTLSARQRQSRGRALLDLGARDLGTGLGSYHLVKYVGRGPLAESEITPGDLVLISRGDPLRRGNPTGTVYEKTSFSVTVAFQDRPGREFFRRGVRIDLYVNDTTYRRMLEALERLPRSAGGQLIDLLLGAGRPLPGGWKPHAVDEDPSAGTPLDPSQMEAAERASAAKDLFLVHGPPGTGKTTTLVEIIERHVARGMKVLATAASNVAADNIVEMLCQGGPGMQGGSGKARVVRVGHPARVTGSLRSHTLDIMVRERPEYVEIDRCRSMISKLSTEQEKFTVPSGQSRRGLSDDQIRSLARRGRGTRGIPASEIAGMAGWLDLQERKNALFARASLLEDKAVSAIFDRADVVCATNSTAGSELLDGRSFGVAVIDEATQSTEPSCLIPLTRAGKAVMAGDHLQLPPTVLSREAERGGLGFSLFERMLGIHGEPVKTMLEVQYRMNSEIMEFPAEEFYEGRLKAHASAAGRRLEPPLRVEGCPPAPVETMPKLLAGGHGTDRGSYHGLLDVIVDPAVPVVFVDTSGGPSEDLNCDTRERGERRREGSTSRHNPLEADLTGDITRRLLGIGIPPSEIGVISPYDDQTQAIVSRLGDTRVEIKTVDGYQGREKDAIIISLVRSNPGSEVGFLKDPRRLNVALTRARKKLVIIGDSATLKSETIFERLLAKVSSGQRGFRIVYP